MVAVRKEIDITELAEPDRLSQELGEHPEGLLVRERGQVIATIIPGRDRELDRMRSAIPVFGVDGSPLPDRRMTSEQVDLIRTNGPIFSDETYEQLLWNRRFDRGLADIGGAIGPMPTFTFTPERLNRILDIIGSIKGIDVDEMRRIVDESRRLSPGDQAEPDPVADATRASSSATSTG